MESSTAGEAAPLRPTVTTSFTEAEQRAIMAKVTWRLIPLLFFCYIIAYIDRINVGFAKLHLREVLGVDEKIFGSVYGLGAGIFFIGYFIFEVPSNLILQRVGARVWIARIMIVWGIVSMAFMFLNSMPDFVMRGFEGCWLPRAAVKRLARWFSMSCASCWARRRRAFSPESFFT